jgi:outer membrane lipoprotein-sorting protein
MRNNLGCGFVSDAMMKRVLPIVAALLIASFAHGAPLTVDSAVDDILAALDARGDNLQTLVADVSKSESDASLGEDPETADKRIGRVVYEKRPDGDVRIRASFSEVQSGETSRRERIEYVLSRGELIDRNYRGRVEITRVLNRAGEKLDLFQLGKGPFPLPIGQAREDVHAQFMVTKIAPADGDPENTVHLRLTPKPESRLSRDFASIDVWVDLTDHLPRRVETLNPTGTTLTRTTMNNVKLNEPVKDQDFELEKIDPDRWQISREAMQ